MSVGGGLKKYCSVSAKAELEEVNSHECEQHQTRNGPIQLVVHQPKTTSDPK